MSKKLTAGQVVDLLEAQRYISKLCGCDREDLEDRRLIAIDVYEHLEEKFKASRLREMQKDAEITDLNWKLSESEKQFDDFTLWVFGEYSVLAEKPQLVKTDSNVYLHSVDQETADLNCEQSSLAGRYAALSVENKKLKEYARVDAKRISRMELEFLRLEGNKNRPPPEAGREGFERGDG